jgi:hypothetical protein
MPPVLGCTCKNTLYSVVADITNNGHAAPLLVHYKEGLLYLCSEMISAVMDGSSNVGNQQVNGQCVYHYSN